MNEDITNYPLSWPVGRVRTPFNSRKRSLFGHHSIISSARDLQGQERWGVGTLDQAFAGFVALPDPNQRKWWEVLGLHPTASVDEIEKKRIELAKIYHPDNQSTGDEELFKQIQLAYEIAKAKV